MHRTDDGRAVAFIFKVGEEEWNVLLIVMFVRTSSLALAASRFFDGSFLPLALGLLVVFRAGRGAGASSSAFAASPSPDFSASFF